MPVGPSRTAEASIACSLVLAATLLLTGCAVGPDFVTPAPPDRTGYTPEALGSRTAGAKAAGGESQRFVRELDLPGQWWTLFHCRALNSLVETALAASPDIAAAQAALRAAKENLHAQQGLLLPALDANAGAIRQQPAIAVPSDAGTEAPTFNLFTGQLNVSYSPDVFGGTRRSIEALAALADQQRFQLEATYLTLTSNLAGAAVQEASLRSQIAATQRIIKIEADVLELLRRQRALGQVAEADVAAPTMDSLLATKEIVVACGPGGVGKTTTTVNVAAALAQAGLRVLVVDIDPQGNASTALGIDHHAEVPSIYDVLVDDKPIADVVQECVDIPNLWCVPATIDLAGAEIELVSLVARETRMERALSAYVRGAADRGESRLDYVLIDCPPSLGLLTVNAFVAADEVFIPIQCEYYALEGLSQLLKNIELIKNHLNPGLHVSTILLTMYDGRTRLSAQVADEVREHFPAQVLRTAVPRSVRISEAPSFGQTVMTYDPTSSGALSYLEAAGELADRGAAIEPSDDGGVSELTGRGAAR